MNKVYKGLVIPNELYSNIYDNYFYLRAWDYIYVNGSVRYVEHFNEDWSETTHIMTIADHDFFFHLYVVISL